MALLSSILFEYTGMEWFSLVWLGLIWFKLVFIYYGLKWFGWLCMVDLVWFEARLGGYFCLIRELHELPLWLIGGKENLCNLTESLTLTSCTVQCTSPF
jgi:hypothetical protein